MQAGISGVKMRYRKLCARISVFIKNCDNFAKQKPDKEIAESSEFARANP
jgi:hypothetical protein